MELIDRIALLEKSYYRGRPATVNNPWPDGAEVVDVEDIEAMPTVDAVEVVHAYWTGLIPDDYAFAEGFANGMTPEEKAKRHEDFIHTTHCSNCKGGFDDRWIKYWKYCPYCGAKMDEEVK